MIEGSVGGIGAGVLDDREKLITMDETLRYLTNRSACGTGRQRSLKPDATAFTVIELIAALAIVAVLIACIVIGLSSARSSVQRAKCLENMRGIASSIILYSSENDSRFPLAESSAWDLPLVSYWDGSATTANPVLTCPADRRPPVMGESHYPRSYSLNANLPERAIAIQQPATIIMLAEWYTGETGPGGASANYQFRPEYSLVEYNMAGLPGQYHKGVSNFVFCDGHAESYDPKSTLSPRSFWSVQ